MMIGPSPSEAAGRALLTATFIRMPLAVVARSLASWDLPANEITGLARPDLRRPLPWTASAEVSPIGK